MGAADSSLPMMSFTLSVTRFATSENTGIFSWLYFWFFMRACGQGADRP